MAHPSLAVYVGTTTATIIHTLCCYWVNTLKFFSKYDGNLYHTMALVDNPHVNLQHGITPNTADSIVKNPASYLPSALSLNALYLRSQSLSSQLNLNMDVDPATSPNPAFFDWLPVDPHFVSEALPTERTVRTFMGVVYKSYDDMEAMFRQLFRTMRLLKTYVLCLLSIYAGLWPTSQSMDPQEINNLLVSRNLIAYAVTRVLLRYPGVFGRKSIYFFPIL